MIVPSKHPAPHPRWMGVLTLLCAISVPLGAATEVVNVLSWTNYIDSSAIPSFEDHTGIEVNYDVIDSNEMLEGKLLAGKSGYDVVVATSDFFGKQVEAGLYRPLPKDSLHNYGNLDPSVMKELATVDPGNRYGVPYMWGTDGIAFNVEMINARMPDAPVDSWKMMFDPDVISRFADCGVAVVDDSDAVIVAAAIYLGHDPNSEGREDLNAAIQAIARIQPYLRYFHSTSFVDDLANGEICLALGYSGDVFQAMRSARAGVRIDYRIPREGAAVWIDVLAVPQDAPHPDAAIKWIDHLLDPGVIAHISNAIFYANANAAAVPLLDPAIRENPVIYPSDTVMKRLVSIRPKSQRFVRMRNRAWTEVKAGD